MKRVVITGMSGITALGDCWQDIEIRLRERRNAVAAQMKGGKPEPALIDEGKKQGLNIQYLEFGTYPEIKTALDSGRIDCFSVDAAILFGYLDDSTTILPDRYSPQLYGIASKKSNTALANLANDTVNEMKASGDLDKLIQKWGLK